MTPSTPSRAPRSRSSEQWGTPRLLYLGIAAVALAMIATLAAAEEIDGLSALENAQINTVDDLLTLALARSLEIRATSAFVDGASGSAQEAKGLFDRRFRLIASFQSSRGELLPIQVDAENARRDLQRTIISDFTRISNDIEQQLIDDTGRPFADCGTVTIVVNGFDICLSDFEESGSRSFEDYLRTLIGDAETDEERELYELILQQQIDLLRQTYINVITDLRRQVDVAEIRLENLGVIPDVQKRDVFQLDIRWVQPFRSGADLSAGLILESVSDNFLGKDLNFASGGKGLPNVFESLLGFELFIPLGRNGGRRIVGAPERASRLNANAAALEQTQQIADVLIGVAEASWNLWAEEERSRHLQDASEIEQALLDIANALIAAEELSVSERSTFEARFALTQSALDQAKRRIESSRTTLAERLGAEVGPSFEPATILPNSREKLMSIRTDSERSVQIGTAARTDVEAAKLRSEASLVLVEAARSNIKRRADLNLAVGYGGLHESLEENIFQWKGFKEALTGKQTGPTGFFRFSTELPGRNREAKGQLYQAKALDRQANIVATDLERRVALRAADQLNRIDTSIDILLERRRTLELQAQTLADTQERFQMGEASVVDTLLTQEQLTRTRLDQVEAERELLLSIERLRYELGLMVQRNSAGDLEVVSRGELSVALLPHSTDGPRSAVRPSLMQLAFLGTSGGSTVDSLDRSNGETQQGVEP